MANILFNNEVIMTTGIVKWFDSDEGRGLIEQLGDGENIPVSRTGFQNGIRIHEGDHVEFEISEGVKGPTALNTRLIHDCEQEDRVSGPEHLDTIIEAAEACLGDHDGYHYDPHLLEPETV